MTYVDFQHPHREAFDDLVTVVARFSDRSFFCRYNRASASSSLLTPTVLNRLLRWREKRLDEAGDRSSRIGSPLLLLLPVFSCGINFLSNNSVGNSSVSENNCDTALSLVDVCRTRFSHATSVKIVFLFRASVTTSFSSISDVCNRFSAVESSSRIFGPLAEKS